MIQQTITAVCRIAVMLSTLPAIAFAQKPPYDVFPPADLVILVCGLLLTELFATKNAVEEELGRGTLLVILIAGVSQLPGLLIALWRQWTRSVAAIPMLCGAYMIAVTGCGAYALYAFDGKADSLNSAAHMHVIVFPVFHCIFAVATYVACGIVSAVLSLFRNLRRRDERSHTTEPAVGTDSSRQSSPPDQ